MGGGVHAVRRDRDSAGAQGAPAERGPGRRGPAWVRQLARVLDLPVTSYYLVLSSTLALTGLGLVMVLSASSIEAYAGGEGNSFAVFNRQALFAAVGLAGMFALSFARERFWTAVAWPVLGIAILLQYLPFVPGVGVEVNGSLSWIEVGGFRAQPAEFVKPALALWIGMYMARKASRLREFSHLVPLIGAILLSLGPVLYGRDLGTGMIIMALVIGCVFVGGLPWRYFLTGTAAILLAVTVLVLTSANRMARITAMFTGADSPEADALGQHWQSNHGLFALASGGWFGVGLGASREKWYWLPEAHNDFIFAIIGEELGLVGTLVVVLLFAVLGYGLVRIVMRSPSRLAQTATAGVFLWLIGQAVVNMGVVAGLFPVIGVPLPFVSAGGSALIATLLTVGMILSFARNEPGAAEAMRAHSRSLRASLAVLASRPSRKR
ncbi:putative lipid II flippase FtsW [Brevibacterium samyangense]|uniref:Probable peptidoglycan glycosyltransferase FtsW n=1 Tax=Brevibacterium samyangense TaxID=366888 RepID=A0ABP5EVD3_9MICO